MISRSILTRLVVPLAALACVFCAPATALAQPASPHAPHLNSHVMRPADNWWCGPGNGAGSLCDGLDPYSTGCAKDSSYIASADGWFGRTEWQVGWHYSWSCDTAWASLLWLDAGTNYCAGCTLTLNTPTPQSVGSDGTTLYSGAYTNQYYLPLCADTVATIGSGYAMDAFSTYPYLLC